jgi:hypothetical protein
MTTISLFDVSLVNKLCMYYKLTTTTSSYIIIFIALPVSYNTHFHPMLFTMQLLSTLAPYLVLGSIDWYARGLVRLKVSDLLPEGLVEKEYALVDDDNKAASGSLVLSIDFLEKTAKDSRKKRGFWRRLYSFLLGRKGAAADDAGSDGEGNDDGNATASNSASASGTPRESTDGDDVPATITQPAEEVVPEGQLFGRPLGEILQNQAALHPDLDVPWFIWVSARSIREKGIIIIHHSSFNNNGWLGGCFFVGSNPFLVGLLSLSHSFSSTCCLNGYRGPHRYNGLVPCSWPISTNQRAKEYVKFWYVCWW